MAEACLHAPARVLGFVQSNAEIVVQPQRGESVQLEQRASLLSAALLKPIMNPPIPSTYMETCDTDSDEDMEEMEGDEEDAGDDGQNCGGNWGANSGSAPIPVPSTSEAFLKAHREALKRFVYAHQIEEMRRQCATYFARQARFTAVCNPGSALPPAPSAPVIPDSSAEGARPLHPQQNLPGF